MWCLTTLHARKFSKLNANAEWYFDKNLSKERRSFFDNTASGSKCCLFALKSQSMSSWSSLDSSLKSLISSTSAKKTSTHISVLQPTLPSPRPTLSGKMISPVFGNMPADVALNQSIPSKTSWSLWSITIRSKMHTQPSTSMFARSTTPHTGDNTPFAVFNCSMLGFKSSQLRFTKWSPTIDLLAPVSKPIITSHSSSKPIFDTIFSLSLSFALPSDAISIIFISTTST